jgi:hypothetical protein
MVKLRIWPLIAHIVPTLIIIQPVWLANILFQPTTLITMKTFSCFHDSIESFNHLIHGMGVSSTLEFVHILDPLKPQTYAGKALAVVIGFNWPEGSRDKIFNYSWLVEEEYPELDGLGLR